MIQNEYSILAKINHENVVKILNYFETEQFQFVVMEYCNEGDFLNYIEKNGLIKEDKAIEWFKQIILGLKSIHEQNIIHRE